MMKLEKIIGEIGRGPNLNRESVIDEVKVALRERDSSEYDKWQEDEFNVNHVFYGKTALLHSASECCKEKMVEALIENGANVNAVDDCGETPLYHGIRYRDWEVIETLIKNKASVNVSDRYGRTPLHKAVQGISSDYEPLETLIVKTLIENGANVNAPDNCEETPLHEAAGSSQVGIVRVLIESGADVNAFSYDKSAPLHKAAWYGTANMVRVLIENGANVNAVDFIGETPLYTAAEKDDRDKVQVLIESGGCQYRWSSWKRSAT